MREEADRTIHRDELYRQVWSRPVREVASTYGVSDRGLAKICDRLHVPVPGRGYWQKVKAGHRAKKKPLPRLPAGASGVVTISKARPLRSSGGDVGRDTRPEPEPVPVPRRLVRLHPAVEVLRDRIGDYWREFGRNAFDLGPRHSPVRVTRAQLGRALRILEGLCRELERRGFSILVPDEDDDVLRVSIDSQPVRFSLIERTERREKKLTAEERRKKRRYPWSVSRYEYSRTGRLTLRLDEYLERGTPRSWSDGEKQHLENCLGRVVAGMMHAANLLREQEDRRRRREAELRETRRRLEEEERENRAEEERRSALLRQVDAWHSAQKIREFVDHRLDLRHRSKRDLELWAEWALGVANELDPLASAHKTR